MQAVRDRASDIHFEPGEKSVIVRIRVDGVLREVTPPPQKPLPGDRDPYQNLVRNGYYRAPLAAGRPIQVQGTRPDYRRARIGTARGAQPENRTPPARPRFPAGRHARYRHGRRHARTLPAYSQDAPRDYSNVPLHLEAVVWGVEQPLVIVNNQILGVGDRFWRVGVSMPLAKIRRRSAIKWG